MRLKRIKIQMSLLTSLQATQALHRNVDVVTSDWVMLLWKVSDWMKNLILIILRENVFKHIVQSINFYHNLVIWIIVMKNNLESEDFLKNVKCNLTFLKSNKEYIFSDEMSERDNYSTIVIDESSIEVREI